MGYVQRSRLRSPQRLSRHQVTMGSESVLPRPGVKGSGTYTGASFNSAEGAELQMKSYPVLWQYSGLLLLVPYTCRFQILLDNL